MTALTIGMATFKDFDGVYFTLQALRLYQELEDTELLVIDNFGDEHTEKLVKSANARYILAKDVVGTAAPRDLVFQEATGDAVLCCDSHVMFDPGVITRLKEYHRANPDSVDLLQGPLVYDDLKHISTHFDPVWRAQMWGIWGTDPRGLDLEEEPFDIPMQGLGAFSCRKDAWLGFNPAFRGFGGEEGYIHEKFRQSGARCLCLPWFRWTHRFGRPAGVPYPLFLKDKLKNYIIGHIELGLDLAPVLEHFAPHTSPENLAAIHEDAMRDGISRTAVISVAQGPWQGGSADSPSPAAPAVNPTKANMTRVRVVTKPRPAVDEESTAGSRAIVCFVDDNTHIIQQFLALRISWLYTGCPDTDLVAIGPKDVLARLPDDLVKIAQQPAADDPVWQDYRVVNAVACMNGEGAGQLDGYSHILRTDADTFITPAWNNFAPAGFTCGHGGYASDDDVRQRIRDVADEHGLMHRDMTNIGMTWYGPTELVRRVSGIAEMVTKHLLTQHFMNDEGAWPGWYRGVAVKYASEIAINHCAPDAQKSELLDASSTSEGSTAHYPHIHCPHTDQKFSKHWFMSGRYTEADAQDLDLSVIRDYAMAMSFESLEVVSPPDNTHVASRRPAASSQNRSVRPANACAANPR